MLNSPLNLLRSDPQAFFAFVVALVLAITFHEFSHAAVATAEGDETPKSQGRLSLNPLRHLDPLGTGLILLVGFGWGKPVQFVPERMRNRRAGAALVGAAGPAANFALALVAAVIQQIATPKGIAADLGQPSKLVLYLEYFRFYNVLLGLLNLLPIPPLDGSRLLSILLPPSRQQIVYFLDRFGFVLLIGIFLLAPGFLSDVTFQVSGFLGRLVGLPA